MSAMCITIHITEKEGVSAFFDNTNLKSAFKNAHHSPIDYELMVSCTFFVKQQRIQHKSQAATFSLEK